MYKLIALDLDGTLLDSNKEVPEENIAAVKLAVKKGITVMICSGRIYSGARLFARQLGLEGPLIACNGALVKEAGNGRIISEAVLGLEECKSIAAVCSEEGIYHHAYISDSMYTRELGYGSAYYEVINKILPPEDRIDINIIEDFYQLFCENAKGAYKFVVADPDPSELVRVRSAMSELAGIDIVSSHYDNFEIVSKGVGKGKALADLAEALGISREEIIAVGDNENDLSMIEYAGLGVAMGNAEKPVKEIADFITCTNNECGVAEVIKRFML